MKYLTFIFLIMSLLTSCNFKYEYKPTLDSSMTQNIQYAYFEHVYNDSQYFGELNKMLQEKKIDKATNFTSGYIIAVTRNDLYNSFEDLALKYLQTEYDESLSRNAIFTSKELHDLIWTFDEVLSRRKFDIESLEWDELTNKLNQLYILLWDRPYGGDFWALLSYPYQSKEKFNVSEIEFQINQLSTTISEIKEITKTFEPLDDEK